MKCIYLSSPWNVYIYHHCLDLFMLSYRQIQINSENAIIKLSEYHNLILFLVYLKDLFLQKSSGEIISFADDTVIFYEDKCKWYTNYCYYYYHKQRNNFHGRWLQNKNSFAIRYTRLINLISMKNLGKEKLLKINVIENLNLILTFKVI